MVVVRLGSIRKSRLVTWNLFIGHVNGWIIGLCSSAKQRKEKKNSYISVCKAHKNQVAIKSNWGYYSVKENHWKFTCFPFIHLVHSNQSILNRKSHRFKSWSTVFKNFIIFGKTHYGSFKIFLSHLTEKEEFNKINKKTKLQIKFVCPSTHCLKVRKIIMKF